MMKTITWSAFRQKEQHGLVESLNKYRAYISLYVLVAMLVVIMPVTSHAEVFVTGKFLHSDLVNEYLEDKPKKSDVSWATDSVSVGIKVNKWFSLEAYYAEYGDEERYKVGELTGLSRDLLAFVDLIIFWASLDPDITATVDTRVKSVGINMIGTYEWLYVKAGMSQWHSSVVVSGRNVAAVSESDVGYGYSYGVGLQHRFGKRWQILLERESHRFNELYGVVNAFGLRYAF